MKNKSYALIEVDSNFVANTIVATEGYKVDGFYLIEIPDGIRCESGMYHNLDDGTFYDKREAGGEGVTNPDL